VTDLLELAEDEAKGAIGRHFRLRELLSEYEARKTRERKRGRPPKASIAGKQLQSLRLSAFGNDMLDRASLMRGVTMNRSAVNIVEGVLRLWARYRGDPTLFIKRCEDPREAEEHIDLTLTENALPLGLNIYYGDVIFAVRQLVEALVCLRSLGMGQTEIQMVIQRVAKSLARNSR
jgi:hypothetical protein